jgi:hypothetical protein
MYLLEGFGRVNSFSEKCRHAVPASAQWGKERWIHRINYVTELLRSDLPKSPYPLMVPTFDTMLDLIDG